VIIWSQGYLIPRGTLRLGQVFGGGNRIKPEETTAMLQVYVKFFHSRVWTRVVEMEDMPEICYSQAVRITAATSAHWCVCTIYCILYWQLSCCVVRQPFFQWKKSVDHKTASSIIVAAGYMISTACSVFDGRNVY